MAQAPGLPSITIPSAIYTTPISQELKNTKLEGDGVRITFLRENWPAVTPLFTIQGDISTSTGQPVYKPWFSDTFSGEPDPKNPTTKVSTAYWQNEPTGKQKGDIRLTLTPHQTFRTTITAEII